MEAITKILSIAIGGALGAVARYLINIWLKDFFQFFPLHTFIINIVGCFLIGFFFIMFLDDRITTSENLRLAIVVGFLGAFTTFSTFELEIWDLSKNGGAIVTALFYLFASVFVGFLGVVAGVALARKI